ncbi:MAG: glycosyltransferase family 4 protein [Lachnospiraceae bacterium]|nr:glycosyltransferase family 4 protein [Lachnospiraceae bacterium]
MVIGLLEANEKCYGSLRYFLDCVEKALNKRRISTYRILLDGTSKEELERHYDALIMFNSSFPSVQKEDGSFLLDFFQCPVFNIFVDPPYYHHSVLKNHMQNLHVVFLDEGHVEYCNRYYPPCKSVDRGFLIGPTGKTIPYEDRKIELLFTGSCPDEEIMLQKAHELFGAEWADNMLELIISNSIRYPHIPMEAQMKTIFEQSMKGYSEQAYTTLMYTLGQYAEFYLRGYYRKRIIRLLVNSGIKLHVAGAGWEKLYTVLPDNLIIEGEMDIWKTADLTANSKILLNIMPWFKEGIHDRILTAMHNETICLTDTSTICQRDFQNNQNIVFYDLDRLDALPDLIRELLNDEEKGKFIAKQGKIESDKYTWDLFVDRYILSKL